MQLIPSLNHTVTIIAVNHKDEPLGILEVVSPQRSNLEGSRDPRNKAQHVRDQVNLHITYQTSQRKIKNEHGTLKQSKT